MIPSELLKPLLTYIVLPLAVLAGLWAWGKHREAIGEARGRAAAELSFRKAADIEKHRQDAANEQALKASREAVTKLNSEKEKLEAQLEANAAAAAVDPSRDRCALSPDSVQRIDSIH